MKNKKHQKIAIITSCLDDWGGSEELWAKSILHLKDEGHEITVYKNHINYAHPEFKKLAENGLKLVELTPKIGLAHRIFRKVWQNIKKINSSYFVPSHSMTKFRKIISTNPPNLMIINQGINFDGLSYAHECRLLNIPYVLIAQKAVDFYWPSPGEREYMKATLLNAKMCFFVSQHNKTLTEEQFGIRLPNSQVVYNPVKTGVGVIPYPSTNEGYRLACVARLFIIDKGQDILLRIMAKEKWKNRPIRISLVGTGTDEGGLKDMAALLNVDQIDFKGFHGNMKSVWEEHHALILPSRSEGLPLSMIEAMSVGRTVLVSNAGGNGEVIEDGLNGFIGEATEKDFEQLMDRAWEQRDKWETIGKKASEYVAHNVPSNPEKDFSMYLQELLN